MGLDLVIKNGTVVDGTGAAPRRADVGILGGRIAEVGDRIDGGTRVIDAEGALVTPGFVDLHTHYDGQVSWDWQLSPSSLHGVTTCVMGNCGVGFAPVRESDHERLIALMEGVEDIPGSVLSEGIRWGWESFAQYMDVVDKEPHAIDFAMQVPHDALRVFVMGERAVTGRAATEEDVDAMRGLLAQALRAGAIGFSTGRSDNHKDRSGADTPAAEADLRELTGLGRAFEGLGHGVVQAVSDFDMERNPARFDVEFDILEGLARAAQRPMSISLMQRDVDSEQWRNIIRRAEKANASGCEIRLQVGARGIGVLLGLEATFHPFIGFPSYKAIAHLGLAERVAAMRDPAFKARLLSEKSEKLAGDGSNIPPLADKFLEHLDFIAMRIFRLGESPNYEPTREDSLFAEAMRTGRPALEILYDALLEDHGRQLLYFPIHNYTQMSLDCVEEMLRHPLSLPGLSDGGAHVGTICDASVPTFMLTHWTRDRKKGRFAIEDVVKRLANDTARYAGLRDRGAVIAGLKADLNVIDVSALRLLRPALVRDLPSGGKRLLQRARGYRATIVSGQVMLENDELTGARPGHLVRAS